MINPNLPKKLNLGCGNKKLEGFLNVDSNMNCRPGMAVDLNVTPYPFEDSWFSEINMDHVLEHLNDPIAVVLELHRISAAGGILVIRCPHFSCNWLHPGHRAGISTKLFDFFKKDNEERYGNVDFKVLDIKFKWMRYTSKGKRSNIIIRILGRFINFLANLNQVVAERIWCYWVGGFEEIYFKIRVEK